MTVRLALSVLLAALLAHGAGASPAFACSCAALTTAESVEGSDAVFLGTATAHDVRVDEVYAGMLPSRVAVSGSPEPCFFDLLTGEQYVVFATWHEDEQRYSTDHCAGTAAATPALIAEVELLTGAGRPPYDVPGGLPDDTAPMGVFADVDRWQVLMVGAGLVFLVLAGIAVVVVRKDNAATDRRIRAPPFDLEGSATEWAPRADVTRVTTAAVEESRCLRRTRSVPPRRRSPRSRQRCCGSATSTATPWAYAA